MLQELGVGAVRHHPAGVHEHDPIRQADGGQPVGDDQGGAALHEALQVAVDGLLDLDIDGAGGVVEHQDRGVEQQGAGNGDALALAAGQGVAALAHHACRSRRSAPG